MPTTTRRETPTQARKAALQSDYTPLYAVAGFTDAVASGVLTTLEDARHQAKQVTAFVRSLPEHVKTLPDATRSRVSELLTGASTAYGDLAGRGKQVVEETITSAQALSGKAEKRAEDVLADVADAVDPAFELVQETVTQARKTVTGRTATETMTSRTAARAAANRAAAESADEAKKEARRAAAKRAAATRAARKAAAAS